MNPFTAANVFSRPYGTVSDFQTFPTDKSVGYLQIVPSGRQTKGTCGNVGDCDYSFVASSN